MSSTDGTGQDRGSGVPPPYDEVRAEAQAVMEASSLSQAAVSRESGIGQSTYGAWFNGTYNGDMAGVTAKVVLWLDGRRAKTRTRSVVPEAPPFLLIPTAQMFWGALEHAQHAPDVSLLVSPPGMGKTMTAEAYRQSSSNVWLLTAEPLFSSGRILLDALADLLGVDANRSAFRVSKGIVAKVRGTGGLLVVDEAQHLPTQALDQLRVVHDLAKIGLALIGNEGVHNRIDGYARHKDHAQLFSRVGMRVPRNQPTRDDVDALLTAWNINGADERKLLRAIASKPGALRGMTKTLRVAWMMAAAKEMETPDRECIRMAWSQLSSQPMEPGA